MWVAYALHLSGGCMIGLHRIYLGASPMIALYYVCWLVVTMFMMIANGGVASFMIAGFMVFLYADLLFIPGMVRRKNAQMEADYDRSFVS